MKSFAEKFLARWERKSLPALIAVSIAVSMVETMASEPKWKSGPFSHISQDEPLRSLIQSLGAANGISTVVSAKITEKISGKFQGQEPQKFLETISEANDLIWYCDGSTLYVYRSEEIRTRMIQLQTTTVSKLVSNLREAGISDSRYPLKASRGDAFAYVSGPPRFVELVLETASKLDAKSMETAPAFADNQLVRIFPLKYAWAADFTNSLGDRQIQVPGVASLLSSLINRQPLGADLFARQSSGSTGGARESQAIGALSGIQFPIPQGTGATAPAQVSIQADVRTNSVVIKDTRENLQRFQVLVGALDSPAGLVELNIAIIDVSSATTTDFGLEWRLFSKSKIAGRGANTVQGQTFSDFGASGSPAVPGVLEGYSLATLAENATTSLMARIQALEVEGKAKITARPTVLTFDNVEAQIDQTQTFHVRVACEREAKLFELRAGTVVKVTPHLVEEGRDWFIKLNVQIEDGSLAKDGAVDNIPLVSNSNITTQAIVAERQSLLLGGFIRTEESTSNSRVPVLGSIPVIGYLFGRTTKVRNNIERVFMITPRIVRTASDAGAVFVLDDSEKMNGAGDPAGGKSSGPGLQVPSWESASPQHQRFP